jgi:Tol biopolymer transport system component
VTDVAEKGRRLDNTRRMTMGGGQYAHAWTPDRQSVVFESERNGRFNIFQQGLDRSVPVQLVAGGESTSRGRFSPDGAWLLYVAGDRQST